MKIIKHFCENIDFYTLPAFAKKVKSHYRAWKVEYDEENRGVIVYNYGKDATLVRWSTLASDMEWFDDAEVVTDRNDHERVMVWLNVA